MASMAAKRCDRCDLYIGEGCDCPTDGSAPRADGTGASLRGGQQCVAPPDRILISPHGVAHLPDACNHHPEQSHRDAGWGWISQPAKGLWEDIGPARPVQATEGETTLVAHRRCGSCLS